MSGESRKRPGEAREIVEFWVVLAEDADGDQGIVARIIPGVGVLPFVSSSPATVERLLGDIKRGEIPSDGETLKVVRFRKHETIWVQEP